jgi:hypothetical protein
LLINQAVLTAYNSETILPQRPQQRGVGGCFKRNLLKYVNALQPLSLRQWAHFQPAGEGETLLSLFDKSKIHELTRLSIHIFFLYYILHFVFTDMINSFLATTQRLSTNYTN